LTGVRFMVVLLSSPRRSSSWPARAGPRLRAAAGGAASSSTRWTTPS